MKLNRLAPIVLALGVVAAAPVLADMLFAPSHVCSKPIKPYRFTSQWEVDSFNDDVRRYRTCIADFVEEQQEAIARHQEAAQDAIDEWNQFVRLELR